MSSSRAGAGAGSAAIPANARKTVQSLKEIVSNGEDEIYTVLKECNMDPNETVQRLLNQDPFHEVRRKRDKKKEWNKAGTDSKVRPASGGTQKGGGGGLLDRGSGRGGSLTRHPLNDSGGGRAKSSVPRENGGVNTSSRASNASGGSTSFGPGKPLTSASSSHPGPAVSVGHSAGLQNGSPSFVRPAPVSQGLWGAAASGHTTMADIVKANGAPLQSSGLTTPPVANSSAGPTSTNAYQQYMNAGTTSTPVSLGLYSSSTDPVLHPSLDARATGTSGAIKREIGTVGNQRTKGDWSSSLTMDSLSAPSVTSTSLQTAQTSASSQVAVVVLDKDTKAIRPSSPSVSVSSPILQDRPLSHPSADTSSSVGTQPRHGTVISSSGLPGPRAPVVGGPFSRPYLSQQHPVGTQKATGAGLEWKPKAVLQGPGGLGAVSTPSLSEAVIPSSPPSVSGDPGLVIAATSKLKTVSIHEEQPVIIPNRLQVAESEQTHLSFGSFAAGFGTSFPATFVPEESSQPTVTLAEIKPVTDTPVEPSTSSSSVNTVSAAPTQTFVQPSKSAAAEEVLVTTNETSALSLAAPAMLQSDLPKLDPLAHQGPHYPYLPAIPNYGGFNVMQQVPVGQYTYEASDSQPPDATRLPSLVPYTDPTQSFYTPIYRPGSDADGRYPFVTSNASNKYNGNMGLVNLTGQNLPSQEVGNSVLPPVPAAQTSQTGNGQTVTPLPQQPLPLHAAYTGQLAGAFGHMQSGSSVLPPVPAAQTSQTGSGQTVAPVPQQPLTLHAYTGQPGGAPHHFANVFGYQYIQPSYPYMHSHPPYQHNYTTNSVYPQAPTGSSYPTVAPSTYPPGGATAVKYPISQYKPGSATGIGPPSAGATGYAGYGSAAPSVYAANPSVSGGSTTGYDDVGVQQYKDSMYIQSQQEGSTVWIQAPLSRDMAGGGMQASSYYNIPGQGQHGTYAHAQQPSHGHTHPGGYGSLYHPPQSGQGPTTHQLLQRPQALATGSGSQTGGYQQPQRTQQTWTNNY